MFWAWTQDTLSGDPATRAFASGGLNVWAYVADAAVPLELFRTVDQPGVARGNYGAAGFAVLRSFTALLLAYVQDRKGKVGSACACVRVEEGDGNRVEEGDGNKDTSMIRQSTV